MIAEGSRQSSLSRVKGYKEDTIAAWLREAAEHIEEIEESLITEYRLERGQLDVLWAYVGNKGEKKVSRNQLTRTNLAFYDDRYGYQTAHSTRDCKNRNAG